MSRKRKKVRWLYDRFVSTVCPRSSDPFHLVTYYIKRVITSWTDGSLFKPDQTGHTHIKRKQILHLAFLITPIESSMAVILIDKRRTIIAMH